MSFVNQLRCSKIFPKFLSNPPDSTIPMSNRRDATFILRVLATNKSPRKPSLVSGSICKASLHHSDFAHVRGAPLPYFPVLPFDELYRQSRKVDSLEICHWIRLFWIFIDVARGILQGENKKAAELLREYWFYFNLSAIFIFKNINISALLIQDLTWLSCDFLKILPISANGLLLTQFGIEFGAKNTHPE